MNNIILEKNSTMDVTVVSNYFLDEYMVKANGEYVKMYLHLLRCCSGNIPVSIGSIADVFEYTEKDVIRALTYWEQIGLLSLGFDNHKHLNHITLKDIREDTPVTFRYIPSKNDDDEITLNIENSNINSSNPKASDPLIADNSSAYEAPVIPKKRSYDTDELLKITANEEVKDLLYAVQMYIKKPLSPKDTNTILYFYDGLHFSLDLIEYLVEYCVSINHTDLRYIEKVAIEWAEEGIASKDEAKNRITRFSSSYYPVLKALGLNGRNPAPYEQELIDKWMNEYGFSTELIIEACNKTIASISKPSFPYIDSILQKWKQQSVTSIDDVKRIDNAFAAETEAKKANSSSTIKSKNVAFNNFPQRNYDYDALERDLLNRK